MYTSTFEKQRASPLRISCQLKIMTKEDRFGVPKAYFFWYHQHLGSLHIGKEGYAGNLLGIPEEESDCYTYYGERLSEVLQEFMSAVELHQILTENDDENEIEPLSEQEIEEMYQQFLKKLDDMKHEEE